MHDTDFATNIDEKWQEARARFAELREDASDEMNEQLQNAESALDRFQLKMEEYKNSAEDTEIAEELREAWMEVKTTLDLEDDRQME